MLIVGLGLERLAIEGIGDDLIRKVFLLFITYVDEGLGDEVAVDHIVLAFFDDIVHMTPEFIEYSLIITQQIEIIIPEDDPAVI